MILFLALVFTTLVSLAVGALYVIADADVPGLTGLLNDALPNIPETGYLAPLLIVGLQILVFSASRFALRAAYSFSGETDAAPRHRIDGDTDGVQRFRDESRGATWYVATRLFASPSNRWTRFFSLPLFIILILAVPLIFEGKASAAAWGLSFLFASTLAGVRRHPDKVAPSVTESTL